MATLTELAGFKQIAVRSDGAKFIDGERDDNLDTSWLTIDDGLVTLGKGLYDELLVVKGEVTDDQIKTWAAMQSPFYDPASNIVYEGAGGRIEMDKHGQRFIRSADQKTMIEMDTETGDARFAGDITGASGMFTGPVKSMGADGDYSLLDSGRLRFFKNIKGEPVENYYVARMASGVDADGTTIELPYWDRPPQIITSLNTLSNLQDDVYVAHSAPELMGTPGGGYKFEVYCRNMKRGESMISNETPVVWRSEGSTPMYIFEPTIGATNWLELEMRINGSGICGALGGSTIFDYRIEVSYRKVGESNWHTTVYDQPYVCQNKSSPFYKTIRFRKSVPEGQYEVKVEQTRWIRDTTGLDERRDGGLTIVDFRWKADLVYNTGLVSWIAFEGGTI